MPHLTLNSGLNVYVEQQGEGLPVICVPGWAYTTEVFAHTLPAIAKHYRAISYDPRSHGRSEVTTVGNNYEQHGADLANLIDTLKLNEFVLLGWSLGVYDIYAYLDKFGFEGAKAVIAVDESPQIIKQSDIDWGEGSADEVEGLIQIVDSENYLPFFADYMKSGFETAPAQELVDRFTGFASSLTPTQASQLLRNACNFDHSDIAIEAAVKVPFLNIIRKDWSDNAINWIGANQPKAQNAVLGGHLMLYEFPDQFNKILLGFLSKNLPV